MRARLFVAVLFAFWLWGASFAVPALANLGLKAWLFAGRLPFRYPWYLLFMDWRVPVLAAFCLLVLATRAEWGGLARRAGVPAPALWMALGLAFFAWRFWDRSAERISEPNRYGFYPSFAAGMTHRIRSDKPMVPDMTIAVNSQGFRDKEWAERPAPGVSRAAVVGDSMVFGYGIPDSSGLLTAQLERELDKAGRGRWEVLNLASLPSAIWYYSEALRRAGLPARPRVLVMSYLNTADLSAYDDQYIKAGLPPRLVAVLTAAGVLRDFKNLAGSLGPRFGRRGGAPASEIEHSRQVFGELVRDLERTRTPLVVWLPFGWDALFDPYRGHPLISFLRPTDLPEFKGGDDMAWYRDPALSIPGDGHPAAAGNAVFARGIARRILEVTKVRR